MRKQLRRGWCAVPPSWRHRTVGIVGWTMEEVKKKCPETTAILTMPVYLAEFKWAPLTPKICREWLNFRNSYWWILLESSDLLSLVRMIFFMLLPLRNDMWLISIYPHLGFQWLPRILTFYCGKFCETTKRRHPGNLNICIVGWRGGLVRSKDLQERLRYPYPVNPNITNGTSPFLIFSK